MRLLYARARVCVCVLCVKLLHFDMLICSFQFIFYFIFDSL